MAWSGNEAKVAWSGNEARWLGLGMRLGGSTTLDN